MGVPVAWMNACFIEDGGFLEIFYKPKRSQRGMLQSVSSMHIEEI